MGIVEQSEVITASMRTRIPNQDLMDKLRKFEIQHGKVN